MTHALCDQPRVPVAIVTSQKFVRSYIYSCTLVLESIQQAMAKCKIEVTEFDDVSSVDAPSSNAKIHGVLTALSPMKKSRTCKYFDREITDGKNNMRLFGFHSAEGIRSKLQEFEGKNTTISLSKCEVKRSRQGTTLEIFLRKDSRVDVSQEFDVSALANVMYGQTISLDELLTYPSFIG